MINLSLENLLKEPVTSNSFLNNKQIISNLDELAQVINQNNKDKGFWVNPIMDSLDRLNSLIYNEETQKELSILKTQIEKQLPNGRNKGEMIALMHSELSEALEGLRKDLNSDHIPELTAEEEELADLLIRILDYAGGYKLRLGTAVVSKLNYNKQRAYMHGKKF